MTQNIQFFYAYNYEDIDDLAKDLDNTLSTFSNWERMINAHIF